MSAYQIHVSITPLCASCGMELDFGHTESRVTGSAYERDNPFERKDRRVFISACTKCFVHVSEVEKKEIKE